jgi:hypothetical protein
MLRSVSCSQEDENLWRRRYCVIEISQLLTGWLSGTVYQQSLANEPGYHAIIWMEKIEKDCTLQIYEHLDG